MRGCEHDVLLFGSDEELLAAGVPFVTEGIAAGDVVIVHGPEHDVEVLRRAFDDDPRVTFVPGTGQYRRMAETIGEYQRLCERENAAGRGVRSTGSIPFGQEPAMRREWMRYEALVGRVLGPYRFSGLCRYDTRSTASDVLDLALAAHGRVVTAEGARPNPHARPAADLLHELAPTPEPEAVEATPAVLAVSDPVAVAPVRRAVLRVLHDAAVATHLADGFVTAVSEVVSNAVEHGRPPVEVRLHTDGRHWLCVVTDRGAGIDDPWTGFDSPLGANPGRHGMGLWVARQLCDQLTISRPASGGSRVGLLLDVEDRR
jgi:anti-sigma regulatory factor (Ser/Thr protein kinase)